MNINRRFYRIYKRNSYTSPYIPAQVRSSNSVNMTSEQTSTQITCANSCPVPANANHLLHKMKLVYIVIMLILQSLPYVAHEGDGSNLYRCNREMTTPQEVKSHNVVMSKGCTLRNAHVKFDLYWMRLYFFDAKQKNPRAYGVNDGVNINISQAVFHNSPIILHNGRNPLVKKDNDASVHNTVPLVFNMNKCNLSGTSGLSLCPDTGDVCMLTPLSRVRIVHSNFNITIQQYVFDQTFRGVFTFGSVHILASRIEIADNDITAYRGERSDAMTVFYLLGYIRVYHAGHFTIQNNKIYVRGDGHLKEMYLWYANSKYSATLTISGKGSKMEWRRNCVAMDERDMSSVHVFHGFWNIIDGGLLLLVKNNFTSMARPSHANVAVQILWGKAGDNIMKINTNGEIIILNTHILYNGVSAVMWYSEESTYKASYKNPPLMTWKLANAYDKNNEQIPALDNSNMRRYMCAS